MLFSLSTDKPLAAVSEALQAAVLARKFGVMLVYDIPQVMEKKGVSFERECLIFEICEPHHAKEVLYSDMRIATALPCRIALYREGDRTVLASLRPTLLLQMFNVPALAHIAEEIEEAIKAMMQDAVDA